MTFAESSSLFSWSFWRFGYAPYRRNNFFCSRKGQFYHLFFGLFFNYKHRQEFRLADGSSSLVLSVGDKLIGNGTGKVWHVDYITELGMGIDFNKGAFNWCAMRRNP